MDIESRIIGEYQSHDISFIAVQVHGHVEAMTSVIVKCLRHIPQGALRRHDTSTHQNAEAPEARKLQKTSL